MVAEQVLDDSQLRRVCAHERGGAVVDYRSPANAVEVKRLTVEELEAFNAAWKAAVRSANPVIPVPGLMKTWSVFVNTSADSSGGRLPNVKKVVAELGSLLVKLEALNIDNARLAGLDLQYRIGRLLGGGPCSVLLDPGALPPGVLLEGRVYGHGRECDLDQDVRDPLQHWLDTGSTNLRDSLSQEDGRRVAVLVVASSGSQSLSLLLSLTKDFPDMESVPSHLLNLPAEIDVLIVVVGDQVLSFTASSGWKRVIRAT